MSEKFDLANYIPVNDRIQTFWNDLVPNKGNGIGRIITEIFYLDPENSKNRLVVVKASIFLGDKALPITTGLAKEREGTGGANKTAFIENAETSSIGRALANLGVLIERNRASREEMETVLNTEIAHHNALEEIRILGKKATTEVQNRIKSDWNDAKNDPVVAFGLLEFVKEGLENVE